LALDETAGEDVIGGVLAGAVAALMAIVEECTGGILAHQSIHMKATVALELADSIGAA
jgi:hypothetical protein